MKYLNYRPLETIALPFSKVAKFNPELANKEGLYFIGIMAIDPDENHYYLAKVGQSKQIGKRIQQYFTHCPIIYQDNIFYYVENEIVRDVCENNCQAFISQYAYGKANGADEWFFVSKECYFTLCKLFQDPIMFDMIANGEAGY